MKYECAGGYRQEMDFTHGHWRIYQLEAQALD